MSVLLAVLMGLGAGLAYASLRHVPEDTVCTVHRFGRYVRTLTPGINFTLPFFDHIAHQVRLVGHQIELAPQSIDQRTAAQGEVYYQIIAPERVGEALDDVDALVGREAQARLIAIAQDVAVPTAALSAQLKSDLNEHFAALGLRITRCQVQLRAAA